MQIKPKVSYYNPSILKYLFVYFKECFKGRSVGRVIQNLFIKKNITMVGNAIDLGSGSSKKSYYPFIKNAATKKTFCDFYSKGKNVVNMNLEDKFLLKDDHYDTVLAFNVLEHIFNYNQFIDECLRIAKKDTNIHIIIPFTHQFHGAPNDYFRISHEAFIKLLNEKKCDFEICNLGFGPFVVAANIYSRFFKLKLIVFFIWIVSFFLDKLFLKVFFRKRKAFFLDYYIHIYVKIIKK